jgi:hypothetical protein
VRFDRALDSLLVSAGIPRYFLGLWFDGCRLEKTILFVPDRESGESIARLFGPQLRAVMPDVLIRVSLEVKAAPKPKPSAMKASWHKMQAKQQKLTEDV